MINVEILQWIHDRMINVHNENYYMDYMHKLRRVIQEVESQQKKDNVHKYISQKDALIAMIDGKQVKAQGYDHVFDLNDLTHFARIYLDYYEWEIVGNYENEKTLDFKSAFNQLKNKIDSRYVYWSERYNNSIEDDKINSYISACAQTCLDMGELKTYVDKIAAEIEYDFS